MTVPAGRDAGCSAGSISAGDRCCLGWPGPNGSVNEAMLRADGRLADTQSDGELNWARAQQSILKAAEANSRKTALSRPFDAV